MEAEGGDSEIVYGTHDDTAMVMSEKVGITIGFIADTFSVFSLPDHGGQIECHFDCVLRK